MTFLCEFIIFSKAFVFLINCTSSILSLSSISIADILFILKIVSTSTLKEPTIETAVMIKRKCDPLMSIVPRTP